MNPITVFIFTNICFTNVYSVYIMYCCMYMGFVREINLLVFISISVQHIWD